MESTVVSMTNDVEFDDYRYANYKYLHFDDIWRERVTVEQDFRLGKGGILWDASWVMSKFLSGIEMTGKNVIELGAGTALPSILCAAKGANVYSTDIQPALRLTQSSIVINRQLFSNNIHCVELDWTNSEHRQNIECNSFDYVLLSDVFYLPELADCFMDTLEYLTGVGTNIVICYKYRIDEIVRPYLEKIYDRYAVENLQQELEKYHKSKDLNLLIARVKQ